MKQGAKNKAIHAKMGKLPKGGVDWKAIERDQKAIDSLPNRGRVLASKMGKKERFTVEGRKHIQSFGEQHPDFHAAQRESKRMKDSWWK